MAGYVIGKELPGGFAGSVSRSRDAVIECFAAKGEGRIGFGDPVLLNEDGTVSAFSQTADAANFAGIAVREVKQAADDSGEAWYQESEPVDVLVRGSICVHVVSGTPVAGGAVYVRTGTGEEHEAGQIVAAASETEGETLQLPNAVFATSGVDAGGIAEITLLHRMI
ncbi:MAG TPA: hypothetical protein IAC36_10180 [Candidatus Aphodomonas merdavium]|nr:hypothetical protein [Candidatus Aphodomonas merdavium]